MLLSTNMGTAFARLKGLAAWYASVASLSESMLDDIDQAQHEQLVNYLDMSSEFNAFHPQYHRIDFVRRVKLQDRLRWERHRNVIMRDPVAADTSRLLVEQNITFTTSKLRNEYWPIQSQFPCRSLSLIDLMSC
jgi:hypothetical protein